MSVGATTSILPLAIPGHDWTEIEPYDKPRMSLSTLDSARPAEPASRSRGWPSHWLSAAQVWKQPRYVTASVLVSLGGLLFGIDTGVIGPITTMPQFSQSIGEISSTLHGAIVSSILIPAAVASFFAGHLADRVGRVRGIAIGTLIFGIGNLIEAASVSLGMLIAGRVIEGIGEGLYLSTLVVYICEIVPPRIRGPLASGPQLLVTLGVCVGYFVCYGTVKTASSFAWRLPFALQAFLSLSFSCLTIFCLQESPRWLRSAGKLSEADKAWDFLEVSHTEREKAEEQVHQEGVTAAASSTGTDNVRQTEETSKKTDFFKVFGKDVWQRTTLGVFLMGFQQLSGIDGVLYYAPLLFQSAGLSSSEASFLASGISAILMFVVTVPATAFSDKWGRKTSTVFGGVAISSCMMIIGALYASNSVHSTYGAGRWVVVACIYLFAIFFCITWAVGIKVYVSEIQPVETRAAASSLAYSANWLTNWTVAFTTPIFLSRSTSGIYFLFGACTLLAVAVCIVFNIPETRGKDLETINQSFTNRGGPQKFVSKMRNLLSKHTMKMAQDSPDGMQLAELNRSRPH